jgi:hypothetical protein
LGLSVVAGTPPSSSDLELIRASRRPSPNSRPSTTPAEPEAFLRIGHALFALVAGLIGGLISRAMFVTRARAPA